MSEMNALMTLDRVDGLCVYDLEIGGTKMPWRWVELAALCHHLSYMVQGEEAEKKPLFSPVKTIEAFGQLMKPETKYPLYTFAVEGTFYLNTACLPSFFDEASAIYVSETWSACLIDLVGKGVRAVRREQGQRRDSLTATLFDGRDVEIISAGHLSETNLSWWELVDNRA